MSRGITIEGSRFVVVGGGSLVGTAIIRQLLAADAFEVTLADNFAFGRSDATSALLEDSRVRGADLDIRSKSDTAKVLKGADGVFHAAALLTSRLAGDLESGVDVNVKGTISVLDGCAAGGVGKLIFSSTVGVYGATQGMVSEDAPYTGAGMHPATAIYCLSKLVGETLCEGWRRSHGLDWVGLRYSTIYGPGQHRRGLNSAVLLDAFEQITRGEIPRLPGRGDDRHDYVFVDDVARANLAAMSAPATGLAVNVASGVSSTSREAAAALARACGASGEVICEGDGGGPAFEPGEVTYDLDSARELIGWSPRVNLDHGMELLAQSLLSEA